MSRDKQTEITELANEMAKAISTAVEQKYIMDETKLEAVLRANGWVKAEEIFAEIEVKLKEDINYISENINRMTDPDAIDGQYETIDTLEWVLTFIAELKKKYTESR